MRDRQHVASQPGSTLTTPDPMVCSFANFDNKEHILSSCWSFCVDLHAQEVGRGQNVSDLELMRADSKNGELSSYFDVASSNNTNSLVSGKVCASCGWMGG